MENVVTDKTMCVPGMFRCIQTHIYSPEIMTHLAVYIMCVYVSCTTTHNNAALARQRLAQTVKVNSKF